MTTRTELIKKLRWAHVVGGNAIAGEVADMLEADAVNDDLTIAYMSGFKAGEDKYKAAARLALDALINLQPIIGNGLLTKQQLAFIDPSLDIAITALKEVI